MENEDAFRKVRDKLAGFESDIRDDSWQLFEKHRLKKERRRRLVGALGAGMLVLFIFGVLIGFRAFLQQRKRVEQHAEKSVMGIQKHRSEGPATKTGIADNVPFKKREILQNDLNIKTNASGIPAKFDEKVTTQPPIIQSILNLTSIPDDSRTTIPKLAPDLPATLKALPKIGPSFYDINLQFPLIHWDKTDSTITPAQSVRRFQLSLGPAIRANYTKPSDNRLTMGPALFSTFPVNPKLSLRGGLALMREHAYVSNTHPEITRNAVRWLNRGEYRWWELEVPLDIQIALRHRPKYSLFGLLGLSSSLYWGEHFKELYQKDKIVTTTLALYNGEVREVEGLASRQETPVTGRSNGIGFAPAAYFSASMILEKKLTLRSSLAIEPQLRYPIGGVTSRNLKFTSIGLQIRILYK